MRGLRDKVIVVAGGGTGIGAATARRLTSEGATVIVGDFVGDAAEQTANQIRDDGGRALAASFDVRDDESIAAVLQTALTEFGRIDGVHANAANMALLPKDGDATTTELDVYDAMLDVNLRGHFQITRLAMPHLLKSQGSIVYTSSETAYLSEPVRVAYAISKSGINTLMRHVATRWGAEGVRANAVAPGYTVTEAKAARLTDDIQATWLAKIHSPRLVTADDIAAAVAFLLSDDARSINGQVINVDGGRVLRS